ncbi:hypothetical protein GCM10010508_67010 [Streptomyces naganishii JCM 4654]|uniref:Secreted protein n=1 Tax=Streptomyces naganishii JCM 4654 TaxID=1306179 RepID=A0A918YBI4_9ACTN|nr:hypothetical protein GCM10010508_67010 [Streptomyces naganishii JCM 4654]
MSFGPPPSIYTQSAVTAEDQRRKRRRKRLWGLLAVPVVAALVVAGLALRDGSPGKSDDKPVASGQGRLDVRETVEEPPASTVGVMGFRFSIDDMSPGEHDDMPGMWATDKILAKGIKSTLAGFRIGTDASPHDEAWRLRLSGLICGYTRHVTGENRTAVLSRSSDDRHAACDHVTFVDLDDGQKIWDHVIPLRDSAYDDPSVTLVHGTVAVTWGKGSDAYDMDSGRRLWRTRASGDCRDTGAAGGRALLLRVQCLDRKQPATSWKALVYKVRSVEPRTGRTLWTYAPAAGIRDVRVPSTDPAVLAVSAGDTEFTELISLDDHGRRRTTISLRDSFYVGECMDETDYVVFDDCQTIPVSDDQVFLRSKEAGGLHNSNWVIGFDLATGNTTRKFESGPNALLYPLRMSGDKLMALRESDDHISPSALVSLDPETGTETPYFYFAVPTEGYTLATPDLSDVLVQNGRLFFGARSADGPANSKQKRWDWLVLGLESLAARK